MLEQLEEFLMDDVVEGGLLLDHFWLLGGTSSSSVLVDGTTTHHDGHSISTTLDDEWWMHDDDDGLILKEIDDVGLIQSDIPLIPSLLSTDEDESINVIYNTDNQQAAAAADQLFLNYVTNSEQEQHEEQQQQQHQTDHDQQHGAYHELEKDGREEEMVMDQAEMGSDGSKNLVSERNRRKRLNNQLFTLRSIVPNITKMDKRSILVDALAYLQSILQQTEAEMEKINSSTSINQELIAASSSSTMTSSSSSTSVDVNILMEAPPSPPPYKRSAALPAISKIGVEKLDDERFILKIAYNKALGAMGQVQRSIQMLGLEITNISVYEQDEHHMETMNFLRVKKNGLVLLTEEDLLHKVQKTAKQLGLLFVSDN